MPKVTREVAVNSGTLIDVIRDAGFDTGDVVGGRRFGSGHSGDHVSIFFRCPRYKRWLWGLIKQRVRAQMFGTLWWRNSARGATKTRWVMDVHGHGALAEMEPLAKILSERFGVDIHLDATDDRMEVESFWDDDCE